MKAIATILIASVFTAIAAEPPVVTSKSSWAACAIQRADLGVWYGKQRHAGHNDGQALRNASGGQSRPRDVKTADGN